MGEFSKADYVIRVDGSNPEKRETAIVFVPIFVPVVVPRGQDMRLIVDPSDQRISSAVHASASIEPWDDGFSGVDALVESGIKVHDDKPMANVREESWKCGNLPDALEQSGIKVDDE